MLLLLLLIVSSNFVKHIYLLEIDPLVLVLELLIITYTYRLLRVSNGFQLLGYIGCLVTLYASFLFYLQLDVFACFLLVSELVVILFALSLLLHSNNHNKNLWYLESVYYLVLAFLSTASFIPSIATYAYWVDWYVSLSGQYNDLVAQFSFFYLVDSIIMVLIAFWLLVMTMVIVQFIWLSVAQSTDSAVNVSYLRKTQRIWAQWYKKASSLFFNRNDF